MLVGCIWTMLSTLAQYLSKSDSSKSWEFAWCQREMNFSSHFTLPLNWDLLLASAVSNRQLIFALYLPFICPIIHHFSVLALVFLSLFPFSSVSFVNLLLIPQCHLSLSCPFVSNLCCLLQRFGYPPPPTPSCVLLCYQDTHWYLFIHPYSSLQL